MKDTYEEVAVGITRDPPLHPRYLHNIPLFTSDERQVLSIAPLTPMDESANIDWVARIWRTIAAVIGWPPRILP